MKVYFLLCIVLLFTVTVVHASSSSSSSSSSNHTKSLHGISLFKFDFGHVSTPFTVCVWIMLASLAKIGFHHSEWISSTIPESCMLILLGLPIGFILRALNVTTAEDGFVMSSDVFFYFLLPPIILDAGYFMPSHVFYLNIGTILLYAILGTIFNSFAVGLSIYACNSATNVGLPILRALQFGSLVSAVDPVAVLAVFEEVHVNEVLYMLVFGESVLNDAASVVLYRTFEALMNGTVNLEQIGLAIASFFIVSVGGTLIGILFALVTSFITKFTEHVRVIEPVFVFLMAYLAYLSAEIFHFSGIMRYKKYNELLVAKHEENSAKLHWFCILFCGIVMKPYVESNVSRKSHTTIKYFLKLLRKKELHKTLTPKISSSCEAIIFMFLGVSLVHKKHEFNLKFVGLTLLFITVYRAIGVVVLTGVANKCGRLTKVKKVEQFIMSYGGLRGAVAFCLAVLVQTHDEVLKNTIITTTISVVIFTVFIQGTTIKKLVEVLGVKKASKREKTMAETVNDRVLGYMVAGVEEIIGVHGKGFWRNILEWLNKKYLRHWLERDPDLLLDEDIVYAERRIAFKNALEYANNPSMIMERELGSATLEGLKRNPSIAMQMAMKAQDTKGSECGMIDFNILTGKRYFTRRRRQKSADRGELGEICSDAFNPRNIGSLIPKAKKTRKRTFSTRKYTLDSLEESEAVEDRYLKLKRNALAHMAPSRSRDYGDHRSSSRRRHKHKHKHRKGRSKKPDMDTLPELTETDETVLDVRATHDYEIRPVGGNHLVVPGFDTPDHTVLIHSDKENSSGESDSDNSDGEGISFLVGQDKGPKEMEDVPGLPSYTQPTKLSQYANKPILDRVPKELTQRDKEGLYEASRWRSFSIDSVGGGGGVNGSNDSLDNVNAVEMSSPWSEPLSPPRRSHLDNINGEVRPARDRTYSIETGM